MKIAVLGTGEVGRRLGSRLAGLGHQVTLGSRTAGNAAAAEWARASGGGHGTFADAAAQGELIVNATGGLVSLDALTAAGAATLRGKVVVDVSNRPTPDASGTSAAEELQARLPDASVIKAFNTAFATRQADPIVDGVSADGFVAGEDGDAKNKVLRIVESIGFRPVDAGSLAAARTLEGMAWLNISRNMQGGTWQDAWVLLGPDSRS